MIFKRQWDNLQVRSVLGEKNDLKWPRLSDEEISEYENNLLNGWQASILHIGTPILTKTDEVMDVPTIKEGTKRARVYPPFQLNRKQEASGSFENVWIPEGHNKIDHCSRIDDSAVKGVISDTNYPDGSIICQGIRIDAENGFDTNKFTNRLLEHICQQTSQWWLRSNTNPLKGMHRLSCDLNVDFTLRHVLRYSNGGKNIASTWKGVEQRLLPLGVERPLTNAIWLRCCHDAAKGLRTDAGLIAFHDAVNNYMTNEDEICVLNLAISLEIMCNRRNQLRGRHPMKFDTLLKTSDLIDSKDRPILRKLYTDRNQIAHGSKSIHFGKSNEPSIEDYLNSVLNIQKKYLSSFKPGEWHRGSQL
jgi:hypothetical protein